MIKGVLYDLGDIFFEAHYWRKWNYTRLKTNGLFEGSFVEFYDLYENFLEDVYNGRIKYNQALHNFLRSLKVSNLDNFFEESLNQKRLYEETRKLYTGVRTTLTLLKKRNIKNIVITDNELAEQEIRVKILEKFKINHLIDKVVTSIEMGVKKPNPEIFVKTLKILDLKKDDVIFVAHDQDEINGAMKIGIKVVEYNNYLRQPNCADIKINKFSEIIGLI